MFSVSRRAVVSRFSIVVMLLVMVLPGLTPPSMPGSVAHAKPTLSRTYAEFITGAYQGALGRNPSCAESQAEYDALASAASGGTLLQEAKRFVSTLFETQASFNVGDLTTYCQTAEYESLNPASCNASIGTGMSGFLTDCYQAFLLREPDSSGFNFWLNNNNGRKHLLLAFQLSGEFGNVVSDLVAGSRPSCPTRCDVTVDPSPMILVSFGFIILDSGTMTAAASPLPCVFIADQAILESPISAFPTSDLFLPEDEWFVFDNGDLVPFSGFTAVGSIGFLAFNGQDFTAKQGTIFLTVFDTFFGGGGGGGEIQSAVVGSPVTGEFATTRNHLKADGTSSKETTNRPFFRDKQGRMRLERGNLVSITDPVAGVRYVLNTKEKTAYRAMINNDRDTAAVEQPSKTKSNKTALSETKSLGKQRVDGVVAAGKEYVSVIPAGSKMGNQDDVQVTYQVWRSEELQLPVRVNMQDPLNGDTTIQFKLQKGAQPDPKLFGIPKGYKVIDAKPVAQRGRPF
ncbi:MAG TPA: DUF4214 domain-containing protein [Pyrinomonadaceae bacterium]|nr:DUF4214 domain-containing protein [Pyrinomonadaceae bacterium]